MLGQGRARLAPPYNCVKIIAMQYTTYVVIFHSVSVCISIIMYLI